METYKQHRIETRVLRTTRGYHADTDLPIWVCLLDTWVDDAYFGEFKSTREFKRAIDNCINKGLLYYDHGLSINFDNC